MVTLEELAKRVFKMERALAEAEEAEVPKVIEQIPFAYTLAVAGTPDSWVMLNEYAPFSGYIKRIEPHWPEGCDHLVQIRVGHGTKQFCPDEGFLALNNVTPSYPFNEYIANHEEIWVEMINGDGANPHDITVVAFLESA